MKEVICLTCQITEPQMQELNLDMLLRFLLNSTEAQLESLLIHLSIRIITMEFMEGKAQTMHSYTALRFMHRVQSIKVIILF